MKALGALRLGIPRMRLQIAVHGLRIAWRRCVFIAHSLSLLVEEDIVFERIAKESGQYGACFKLIMISTCLLTVKSARGFISSLLLFCCTVAIFMIYKVVEEQTRAGTRLRVGCILCHVSACTFHIKALIVSIYVSAPHRAYMLKTGAIAFTLADS